MNFSIVIPTKNRSSKLQKLLLKLIQDDYTFGDFEIIVVDNFSTDLTVQTVKKIQKGTKKVRLLLQEKRGPSYCRNTGFQAARYRTVIFIDDDVVIPHDFLNKWRKKWQQYPKVTAIGVKVIAKCLEFPHLTQYQKKQIERFSFCFGQNDQGNKDFEITLGNLFLSACFSYKKSKGEMSLFNEELGVLKGNKIVNAEDFELCTRLILEQKKLVYTPDIKVYNNFSAKRFDWLYICQRHLTTGKELALYEKEISKKFGYFPKGMSYHEQLRHSVKDLLLLKNLNLFKMYINSMFQILVTMNYYLTFFSHSGPAN